MDSHEEPKLARQSAMTLDPADPFEAAIEKLVQMNRRKRRDYAHDSNPFSNFEATARRAGFRNRWQSAIFNCDQKLERLSALVANGRADNPTNESVEDTLLDNAVYAVLAYAMHREDATPKAANERAH